VIRSRASLGEQISQLAESANWLEL